jgi:hypothetical protein
VHGRHVRPPRRATSESARTPSAAVGFAASLAIAMASPCACGGTEVVRGATDELPKLPEVPMPTVASVSAAILRIRDHGRMEPVRVDALPDAALRARRRALRELHPQEPPSHLARLIEPESAEARARAQDESVRAFYELDNDAIVVPQLSSRRDRIRLLGSLAHELEHAITFERFGRRVLDGGDTPDERLARHALREGDATATAAAIAADDAGIPIARVFIQKVETTAEMGVQGWAPQQFPSHAEAEDAHFAYGLGTDFVVGLWRVGGFRLVDVALQKPPASTAQILEPQRFIDGEQPVPVAPLASKGDLVPIEGTTLGAFRVGAIARRCGVPGSSGNPARGWDGDRLTLLGSPSVDGGRGARGDAALIFVSTFRTEAAAERFEPIARGIAGCLSGTKQADVVRRGTAVVATSGKAGASSGFVDAAFASIGTRPPDAPLAKATIPPNVPLPRPRPGEIDGDVFRSSWLGIEMRIPPPMEGKVDMDGLSIEAGAFDARLTVSERYASAEQNERALQEVQASIESSFGRRLEHLGDEREVLPLGTVLRRRFAVEDAGHHRVSIDLLPICNGTGSLVYATSHAVAEHLARAPWLETTRIGPQPPPVCARLDPR